MSTHGEKEREEKDHAGVIKEITFRASGSTAVYINIKRCLITRVYVKNNSSIDHKRLIGIDPVIVFLKQMENLLLIFSFLLRINYTAVLSRFVCT